MLKREKVKIGQTVYLYGRWESRVFSGTVCEILEGGVKVDGQYYVLPDGSNDSRYYGSTGGIWENVWATAEEAYAEIAKRKKEKVKKYCEEIVTVIDLLAFPLNHCFCGEEYTDWQARQAYIIRAKELLGVDLEE